MPIRSAFGEAAGIDGKPYVLTPAGLLGDTTSVPHLHRYHPATQQ